MQFDLVFGNDGIIALNIRICDIFISDSTISTQASGDAHLRYLLVRPITAANEIASCHEPVERAVCPDVWDRREKVDEARLALQEHFTDTRNRAEIAVDLEGRMGAPKIGKRIVFEYGLIEIKGAVSHARSRPCAKAMRGCPTR